jgi:hypothetical protein
MNFKFYVERSGARGCDRLAIVQTDRDRHAFVQPFILKSFEPSQAVPEGEAYCLADQCWEGDVRDFLQAAADAAWDAGIRPSQVKDMTSEVAAVRFHLEDMRKLVFSPMVETAK